MKLGQIIGFGFIAALIVASAYAMFLLFGLVGVGLFAAFTLPVLGIIGYVGDFNLRSGGSTSARTYESKGAKEGNND